MKYDIILTTIKDPHVSEATDHNGTRYRLKYSSNWIYFYLGQRTIRLQLDTVLDKNMDSFLIHEIGTIESPDWWSGFNNNYTEPQQNVVEMLDSKLMDRLRNRTAMVHYDQSLEAFPLYSNQYDYYTDFYNEFKRFNLPPSQFIYTTSNLMEEQLHDKWCRDNNITERMNVVSCNYFAAAMCSKHFFFNSPEPITVFEHLAYKHHNQDSISTFNCLNRIVRQHRVSFVAMMNYYNLLENNKVSHDYLPPQYHDRILMTQFNHHPAFDNENVTDLLTKLPLVLDTSDFVVNQAQNFFTEVYLESWVSVITETYYSEYQGEAMFFSEKIYKPIRARHPFILVSVPGSLKALREQGFKTFDQFWDESYDDIQDDTARLVAICNLLNNLSKKTHDEWIEMYKQMIPILEHNMKHLTTNDWIGNLYSRLEEIVCAN
jgi:hypothetical protein